MDSTQLKSEFQKKLLTLQEMLLHYACVLTSNDSDAKDLLQETILRALTKSDLFEVDSNLPAWTRTIMHNIFVNNYRKKLRQKLFLSNVILAKEIEQVAISDEMNPEFMLIRKELRYIVEKMDDERKLSLKFRLDGLKYKEISVKMNMKIGRVKFIVYSSQKRILKIYDQNS